MDLARYAVVFAIALANGGYDALSQASCLKDGSG